MLLLTDAFADLILARFFGAAALSNVTYREYSLWNGSPTDGSGTEQTPGSGSYNRTTFALLSDNEWVAGTGANGWCVDNDFTLSFPAAGNATTDWNPATMIGISLAASAAPVAAILLADPVTVTNGSNVQFIAATLKIEINTPDSPWLLSQAWGEALLLWLLGATGTAPSTPATWYLSLWLGNPFAGGTEVTTSGTGYARIAITNSTGFTAPAASSDGTGRSIRNAADWRWPASGGAVASWGNPLYVGLSDGSVSAPLLARKLPGAVRTIGPGGFVLIPAGGLEFTLRTLAP